MNLMQLSLKGSPLSNEVVNLGSPDTPIGTYHVSAVKPFTDIKTTSIAPPRKRRRPKKSDAVSSTSSTQLVESTFRHDIHPSNLDLSIELPSREALSIILKNSVFNTSLSSGIKPCAQHLMFGIDLADGGFSTAEALLFLPKI
ncbi:hypothetical protein CEXT_812871 [Caerostris extrusa]|uniref:Uncharacterized protein n=1 Tax=Caerostris extrusa TaxID=172846 RepID=A0AAV4NFE8_CAEEX|nr:hypothetical protein CEXT_812871 [Caerostris extrusa]